MLPLLSTLIVQAAGGKRLGRIMSVVSLPTSLGPILGPVVGGLILGALDWRWLFWVNVPFCVVGFVLAWRLLPADAAHRAAEAGHPRARCCCLRASSACCTGCPTWARRAASPGRRVRCRWSRASALHRVVRGLRRAPGRPGAGRHPTAGPPAGLVGVGAAVPVRGLALRRDAAAAAVLAGGPRLRRARQPGSCWSLRESARCSAARSPGGSPTPSAPKWVAIGGFALVGLSTVPFALAVRDHQPVVAGRPCCVVRGFGLGAVIVPLMTVAFVGPGHAPRCRTPASSPGSRSRSAGPSVSRCSRSSWRAPSPGSAPGGPRPASTKPSGGPSGSPPSPSCVSFALPGRSTRPLQQGARRQASKSVLRLS